MLNYLPRLTHRLRRFGRGGRQYGQLSVNPLGLARDGHAPRATSGALAEVLLDAGPPRAGQFIVDIGPQVSMIYVHRMSPRTARAFYAT